MNFIECVRDVQKELTSKNYLEWLYTKLMENCSTNVTSEDEEIYRSHIPVDFTAFLQTCVKKLRKLKRHKETDWSRLNEKYLSTLIWYVLEEDDSTDCIDNSLLAANIFILINSFDIPTKSFFYEITFSKILKVLKDIQDTTNNLIMLLLDDIQEFLVYYNLPEDLVNATASVLHDFTYCNASEFKTISTEVNLENVGYKGFANMQVLVEKLAKQKNEREKLYPVLLILSSSLKTSNSNKLSRTVQLAHQHNVRLFIKKNLDLFSCKEYCLVTDMLKFVCVNSDYDEHEAIVKAIQQLPKEKNLNFLDFFGTVMVGDVSDFRKNCLVMVLVILKYLGEHETDERQTRTETFLLNVIKLLADKHKDIRERALAVISEASDDSSHIKIIKRIMGKTTGNLNKDSIMYVIGQLLDPHWKRKSPNINYIKLICNLLQADKTAITIKTLNKFRCIALGASPYDLKPCIGHLKKLIITRSDQSSVVMYVLSIFVKQSLDPMGTSAAFAKELHELIFSNIEIGKDRSFVWNLVNLLISNNFGVFAIFDQFNTLHLLKENKIRILMEYKIHEPAIQKSALKLLCVLLNYIQYGEHHCLDEKIETFINGTSNVSSDNIYLILYALNKILEKKKPCTSNKYHHIHKLLCQAFKNLSLPVNSAKYLIELMATYSRLTNQNKDSSEIVDLEETLENKLKDILDDNLKNPLYFLRDVVYVSEYIVLHSRPLTQETVDCLRKIIAKMNSQNLATFQKNQQIWAPCLFIYIKNCFINSDLVHDCVENLELLLRYNNEQIKLLILYGLMDMCAVHLKYYDPIVPHLFTSLYSKNPYMRFIALKILMKLVNNAEVRLVEGQYFLFMSLLADDKDVIARNIKIFVNEKFVKNYPQTIAKYFVASIIHYNLYYEHPSISLTLDDRDLLKKKEYSSSDRFTIYYSLFNNLPENSKFSILNQLNSEVLMRIENKSMPRSPEALQILEDSLKIIISVVPVDRIGEIGNDKEFYKTEIEKIEKDLLVRDIQCLENRVLMDQCNVLKKLLKSLFELLYGSLSQNAKFCQNLFATVIILTKGFYPSIKRLINEDGSKIKCSYRDLSKYYDRMKDQFEFCLLSFNPFNISSNIEKQDVEFYVEGFCHFELIPSHVITGINET